MKIRMLDQNGDWTFGNGLGNYLTDQNAVAANIATRLQMFYGDCFFDAEGWVDWWNLLGSKNEAALLFSIKTVILESQGVSSVTEVSVQLDQSRNLSVTYSAVSVFGQPVSRAITIPVVPYPGINKFLKDLVFTGQTSIQVDTSLYLPDARNAVWILYDIANGFAPVLGAVQSLSATTVQVSATPPLAGTFRLIGIA